MVQAVVAAVEGGVHAVQLREKDLTDSELIALGRSLKAAIAGRALFMVNGGAEVTQAIGADGVHLPEASAAVPGWPFGRSVHSVESALAAQSQGPAYLTYGNVYETGSHPGAPAAGLDRLRAVTSAVTIPVLAIGGITAARIRDVTAAGAAGIAVISAILASPDPYMAAAELLEALG